MTTEAPSNVEGWEVWAEYYNQGMGNWYPDENLVRIVRGDYISLPDSGRVLDIGFGVGANMLLFAREGYEVHGLEVSEESLAMAESLSEEGGFDLELGLIEGTTLPYPTGSFDIVLSWNSIYYHGSRTEVKAAIDEVHRVLQPGGVFLLSVPHPDSQLTNRLSEEKEDGTHVILESRRDTREGTEIFFESTIRGWEELLSKFQEVRNGGARFDLFGERQDAWRYFLARKRDA